METKKKIRVKAGDVFQIPIDEARYAYGQVAKKGDVLRVLTYNKTFPSNEVPEISNILQQEVLLLTDTMDALIYHGEWKICGNAPVRNDLPKPKFKFGSEPTFYIIEHDSEYQRIATVEETNQLDFQFSVAPIRIQNAMQAYFGVKEWKSDYDKLTYQYCLEKSQIQL